MLVAAMAIRTMPSALLHSRVPPKVLALFLPCESLHNLRTVPSSIPRSEPLFHLHTPFDSAVVLFHGVVEIPRASVPATLAEYPFSLELFHDKRDKKGSRRKRSRQVANAECPGSLCERTTELLRSLVTAKAESQPFHQRRRRLDTSSATPLRCGCTSHPRASTDRCSAACCAAASQTPAGSAEPTPNGSMIHAYAPLRHQAFDIPQRK